MAMTYEEYYQIDNTEGYELNSTTRIIISVGIDIILNIITRVIIFQD